MTRHLIIAGAEKAGTTSLYGYLAAHPAVCASRRKETDHFRDPQSTAHSYATCFDADASDDRVRMESSPGYMAEATAVAPRLAACLPQAKLVFVLRDPVERLRSCYRFYQSRLHVPSTMSFDAFVTACLDDEDGQINHAALSQWHLRAAARGRYERLLPAFEHLFPADQCLVLAYERLRDPAAVTREIAQFAGIDDAYYEDFSFARENVSFRARNRLLQRVAVTVNDRLETLWRSKPALKRNLLRWYKHMNEEPLQDDKLSPAVQARLEAYYEPTWADMRQRLSGV